MQYLACDIETTGLNPFIHGITEFAAIESTTGKVFYRWFNPENYIWTTYCIKLHMKWLLRVIERIEKKQLGQLSRTEPKIIEITDLATEFEEWLTVNNFWKEGEEHPRFTALGKNFGSFDLQFLKRVNMGDYFRHRDLNPTSYYTMKSDKLPPDLKVCKERAIERGCIFDSAVVAHTAIEDAMDTMTLYEFYHKAPWPIT